MLHLLCNILNYYIIMDVRTLFNSVLNDLYDENSDLVKLYIFYPKTYQFGKYKLLIFNRNPLFL